MSQAGVRSPSKRWRSAGFFLLRTPFLSDSGVESILREFTAQPSGGRRPLHSFLPDAARTAIRMASPSLASKWKDAERATDTDRATLRYLLRMSRRPAPFGWMAGISVGSTGTRTRLELAPEWRRLNRASRPLQDAIQRRMASSLRDHDVRYRANPSVYRAAGDLRFTTTAPDGEWIPLATVPERDSILAALEAASTPATIDEIVEAVRSSSRADPEERDTIEGFVRSLVGGDLLQSEWDAPVTGAEPLEHFRDLAERLAPAHPATVGLASLATAIDEAATRTDPAGHVARAAAECLDLALDEGSPVLDAQLFNPGENMELGRGPIAEMARVGGFLRAALPTRPSSELHEFRARFEDRFGLRAVPLPEAIDPQIGVGYGDTVAVVADPLLGPLGDRSRADPDRARWLRSLLSRVPPGGAGSVLELHDGDAPQLGPATDPGAGYAVMATIAARDPATLDRGNFTLLSPTLVTGAAAAPFARWCHADPRLHEFVDALVGHECDAHGDAIVADVCFTPPGPRSAIALRPCLYPVELEYGGRSGLARGDVIRLADILVSVRGNRVLLHHRANGRPVLVRIATTLDGGSHAFPPAYRFLAAVELQWTGSGGTWTWGTLEGMPRLPRVTYRRTVLSPETWNLHAETGGGPERPLLPDIRERAGLPRWISMVERGRRMPIDLDCELQSDLLESALRTNGSARVEEDLAANHALIVRGPGGGFRNEVIVPFLGDQRTWAGATPFLKTRTSDAAVRSAHPGGDVLSLALYSDPVTQNTLVPHLREFARATIARAQARRWHYLRFRDPDPHLRFRLLGIPRDALGPVLANLHDVLAQYRDAGRLWRTRLDTWDRELERYGGIAGHDLAEVLFEADSDACASALAVMAPESRSIVLAVTTWSLLAALEPSSTTRIEVLERFERAARTELRAGRKSTRQIDQRFRDFENDLTAVVTGEIPARLPGDLGRLLDRRDARIREVWPRYRDLLDGLGGNGRARVIESLVHLHVCRCRGDELRETEFVLYSLLRRAARAQAARLADDAMTHPEREDHH